MSKTQRQMQDKRLNPNWNDENDASDDSVWILLLFLCSAETPREKSGVYHTVWIFLKSYVTWDNVYVAFKSSVSYLLDVIAEIILITHMNITNEKI